MISQNKYGSKLAGTTVLIVGGTSGIGFGVAEASIENNVAHVYVASSSTQNIESAVSRLKGAYPDTTTTVTGIQCDLGDESTLEKNIEGLFSQISHPIDHIIFTAGDPIRPTTVANATIDSFKQASLVRFTGGYLVAKHGCKYLTPGPRSSITLTSGVVGDRPHAGWSITASYSAALHGMARGLALELKPIRVNVISSGAVETELWAKAPMSKDAVAQILVQMGSHLATGQIGQVEDIVESYLYVMKDKNVTGTVIRSDGGALIT